MSQLVIQNSLLPLPRPRVEMAVRVATQDDVPFIDALQKKASKALGFMNFATLRGKIEAGHVLVAEGPESRVPSPELGMAGSSTWDSGQGARDSQPPPRRLGYVIGNDKYLNRQELGVVYQLNVVPEARRSLVAANLLKALFDNSAYGCKLYCCWCAQDLEANRFWEAMGFVPLAFRTGSERKARTHIFWQKRIREGDVETPWWFPSETRGGMMGEPRLVFPIPPGTHWRDAKPMVLPGVPGVEGRTECEVLGAGEEGSHGARRGTPRTRARKAKEQPPVPAKKAGPQDAGGSGLRFGAPPPPPPPPPGASAEAAGPAEKPKRKPRERRKNDPRLVAAARELRDRYLEEVNRPGSGYALMSEAGKYDVTRVIASEPREGMELLPAA